MPKVKQHEKWWEIVFEAKNGKPVLKHSSTEPFSPLSKAKTLNYVQFLPSMVEHVYHTQNGAAGNRHVH